MAGSPQGSSGLVVTSQDDKLMTPSQLAEECEEI